MQRPTLSGLTTNICDEYILECFNERKNKRHTIAGIVSELRCFLRFAGEKGDQGKCFRVSHDLHLRVLLRQPHEAAGMIRLHVCNHKIVGAAPLQHPRPARYLNRCFALYNRCCPSSALYPARPLASIFPVSPRFSSL